jgi:lysophospholipase L1-like esterase
LNRGFTKETIIKNLTLTIDTLKKHNIKPVLTTIPYVTQKRNMEKPLNDQIKETNKLIYELAEKQNLSIIDLNIRISENGFRKDKYAISDGLHFNANTYLVWGEEVEKAIELFNF